MKAGSFNSCYMRHVRSGRGRLETYRLAFAERSSSNCNVLLISEIVASLAARAAVVLAQSSSTAALCASSLA